MKQTVINWVLAHEPYHVFIKAADNFAREIEAETNGRYKINVINLDQWNELADQNLTNLTTDREKIINLVDNGSIDMATVYASTLGTIDKDMYALTMPFLFNDHETAQKTIDGHVGQHMLAKVAERSNIRGLVFTYSGGFRIVPSKQAIETLEDFYRMNIGCGKNPVAIDTFKAVGANPVPMFIEDLRDGLANNIVEGGETTYTRFFVLGHNEQTRYINDNEHSLFLTSLIINKQLWQSMGEEVQEIFAAAALRAAKIEREDSLADNLIVQKQAALEGIPTVTMTAKERARFESATKDLYSKYQTYFSPGLLDSLTNGTKH
jgi:TRAP-type C4-dicarboxylate transport system substrate-binding protein